LFDQIDSKIIGWKKEILPISNDYSKIIEDKEIQAESLHSLFIVNQDVIKNINTLDEDLSLKILNIAKSCYQLENEAQSNKIIVSEMITDLKYKQIQTKWREEIKPLVAEFIETEINFRETLISQL